MRLQHQAPVLNRAGRIAVTTIDLDIRESDDRSAPIVAVHDLRRDDPDTKAKSFARYRLFDGRLFVSRPEFFRHASTNMPRLEGDVRSGLGYVKRRTCSDGMRGRYVGDMGLACRTQTGFDPDVVEASDVVRWLRRCADSVLLVDGLVHVETIGPVATLRRIDGGKVCVIDWLTELKPFPYSHNRAQAFGAWQIDRLEATAARLGVPRLTIGRGPAPEFGSIVPAQRFDFLSNALDAAASLAVFHLHARMMSDLSMAGVEGWIALAAAIRRMSGSDECLSDWNTNINRKSRDVDDIAFPDRRFLGPALCAVRDHLVDFGDRRIPAGDRMSLDMATARYEVETLLEEDHLALEAVLDLVA